MILLSNSAEMDVEGLGDAIAGRYLPRGPTAMDTSK